MSVRVIHTTLGRVIIESVQGQTTSATVVITFDAFTGYMKLAYRFTKLVVK